MGIFHSQVPAKFRFMGGNSLSKLLSQQLSPDIVCPLDIIYQPPVKRCHCTWSQQGQGDEDCHNDERYIHELDKKMVILSSYWTEKNASFRGRPRPSNQGRASLRHIPRSCNNTDKKAVEPELLLPRRAACIGWVGFMLCWHKIWAWMPFAKLLSESQQSITVCWWRQKISGWVIAEKRVHTI